MSKRMKNKEKSEKKSENQKKREIWIWWYLGYGKCIDGIWLWQMGRQYSAYDSNIMGGTQPTMVMWLLVLGLQ